MKYCFKLASLLLFFCVYLNGIKVYAQQSTVQSKNGMTAGLKNYTSFTAPFKDKAPEVVKANLGYENHPELGLLFAETPCDNCYELIGNRTEMSKTFIKEGTGGRDIMQQTSNEAMHYRDAKGNWLTIRSQLQPGTTQGVYATTEQPVPVTINTIQKYTAIGNANENFRFNNNLELLYATPDGNIVSLGVADWSHHTAGDDGVYVTNAWPGVDIEMHSIRGAVKTNFIINHAMPAYAAGKLLVRDHLQMSSGMKLNTDGQKAHIGNLDITNNTGENIYTISGATAFEKHSIKSSFKMLEYGVNGNVLDITLPGDFLNRPSASYPVIIDPLVSISSNSNINGSTYSPGFTVGCVYTNSATVPAKVTVTDVQFSFQYLVSGGAALQNGAFDFKLGTCRSPSPTTIWWSCNSVDTFGTCTGTNASIFPSLASCMPAPRCTQYNLNLTMDFYQDFLSDPPCSNLYVTAGSPLTITVFGHTIESTTATANPTSVCQGQSSSLSATSQYGVTPYTYTWTPGSIVGSPVNVNPTGTTVYTVTARDACGDIDITTTTVSVNPISSITGNTQVCLGSTSALHDIATGGTWSSSNTNIATINSSGVVSGVTLGTAVISYITPTTCYTTTSVTVNPVPASITGATTVCAGSATQLSEATTGGTWSSNNNSIATVTNTGLVTGVTGGTALISYTTAAGCSKTVILTVNPLLSITGPTTVCKGSTITLSNTTPGGGTWSSVSTAVATINTTGTVTGVTPGTSIIKYTTGAGCTTNTTVTVLPLPTAITGAGAVCQGSTISLSDATIGGTWTSGNAAIATVNSSTGLVGGASGGVAVITYTAGTGCKITASVTVNPLGPVTGTRAICVGGTATLNNIGGSGTWTSSNTSIATITSTTGIVTGVSPGSSNITYTSSAGCVATTTVVASVATSITGNTTVCQGAATTLSNAAAGGTWTSSNTSIAQVTISGGVVTGISGGLTTITYTTTGGCFVTTSVTVNPAAPVSGTTTVCAGSSSTLSDATAGGTWSSSNTGIATIDPATGIVSGITGGSSTISYNAPAGCTANVTVTVNPISPITGVTTVCQSATTTLSNAVTGGTWSSGATAIATAGLSSGVVSGVSPGSAPITYTMPTGCTATTTVTVNAIAPVSGNTIICAGSTTTLSDSPTGGTWSSNNTNIATVDPTNGTVFGVATGSDIVRYTTTTGCSASTTVTVNTLPSTIAGNLAVCQGSNNTLSDLPTGGTWSSANTAIATIGLSSGIVGGILPGTSVIVYTTAAGCTATATVTVNPVAPITGTTVICQGTTTTLSNAITGGTWSSANTSIATADAATGDISGITGGATNISYTTDAACVTSIPFTVNTIPTTIVGNTTICQGYTTTLSNSISGGTWSSSSTAVATAGITNGVITAVTPGITSVTYSTAAGCSATTTVIVNPLASITGPAIVCQGYDITLSDTTPGGTWSSSNTAIATADINSGDISGVAAGNVNIHYTTPLGCVATMTVSVSALPTAIAGNKTVCAGSSTTLSNTVAGGTWSSAATGTATIDITTGLLTGVSAGTTTIIYSTAAGCTASTTVNVNPLPAGITGIMSICRGTTTTLSDITASGTWTSSNTTIATIGRTTGVLTGVTAGNVIATYTSPLNCYITTTVTIAPLPSVISGINIVCSGSSTTLGNTLPGGTWSSVSTGVATISANSGILYGVTAGTTMISYITPAGCFATTTATVNPTPVISGFTSTNPTTCITHDGTITLNGLSPGSTFTVRYFFSGTQYTVVLTANGSGGLVITGLAAGTYSTITVTSALGCNSDIVIGPIVLTLPPPPAVPVANNNTPICDGDTLQLTATDVTPGVTYTWSGPVGFISTLQNPVIDPAHINQAGTYSVTATRIGCISGAATTVVVINPIPHIAGSAFTNPTTCYGTDGTITLTGLTPGLSYFVTYIYNNNPVSVTIVADGSGNITITGLSSGTYADISVSSYTCISDPIGPIVLSDPLAPPPPVLGSNSPICAGDTLFLTSADPITNLTYSWTGPNGFASILQTPIIPNVTLTDSGTYSLTISHLNCLSASSEYIIVHPPVVLDSVTPSQEMPYDGYVQLYAAGALLYTWKPNDGTLNNPNIHNPVAAPKDSTTYVVIGMNEWGCRDSASVTITINYGAYGAVPNAFSPNGDGDNDIFRIINQKLVKLIEFSVYDRWGKRVYHNTYDSQQGWDGKYNGVPQDMGVYYYSITIETPDGKTKYLKGDVTLVR